MAQGGRGGAAALALLGLRRGWAADVVARTACLRPRAKVGESQRCSRVHPWTSVAMMAPAGGGGAAIALLCSCQGQAADASARPAHLRPMAEVRGGQRLLLVAVLALQLCNL